MKNYWGDPDDDDSGIPEWMLAKTYQNGGPKFKGMHNKSLEDVCADVLKKPPVPVLLKAPNEDDLK